MYCVTSTVLSISTFIYLLCLCMYVGDIIVDRRKIPNPEAYALFTVVDGQASIVDDDAKPQEIKLEWTLRRTLGTAKMQPPSNPFFAYKLRTSVPDWFFSSYFFFFIIYYYYFSPVWLLSKLSFHFVFVFKLVVLYCILQGQLPWKWVIDDND